MAWSQADIDALKAAIADRKGARSMTFSDQSVTFDSIADMVTLLTLMQADVTVAEASGQTRRVRFAATSKGV